jgi:peptide/nickel transport system substrate-binding protein
MREPNRKAVVMTSFSAMFRSIATIGLPLALLAALTVPLHAAEPHRGGSLVYAYLSGPGTLDPHVASSMVELEVIHHIFEPLVAIDGSYNAKPVLASKIETSADATVFSFTLRKGVKFQNGKEMTSADVLASFERYRKVSPNASVLADVDGFEAPDPYSFVIRTLSSSTSSSRRSIRSRSCRPSRRTRQRARSTSSEPARSCSASGSRTAIS